MSVSIRIDDALYQKAKISAKGEMRSIAQQVAFWAKVGQTALDNPDLPIDFIKESLLALSEPKHDATPFVPRNKIL